MPTTKELIAQIEKLPLSERLDIIDAIMKDVIPSDPDIDRIWAQEAQRRWEAYKNGDIKTIPYEEVMSKYKKA